MYTLSVYQMTQCKMIEIMLFFFIDTCQSTYKLNIKHPGYSKVPNKRSPWKIWQNE